MGWTTACVLINNREDGFLGTFPAHLGDQARQLISELGWDVDGAPKPSQLDAGLAPPAGWFCVGAYAGASVVSGNPDLFGVVEAADKPIVQRCLSLFPEAQALFWELDESTGYMGYSLYKAGDLQRALLCDPDRGAIVNEGDLQAEEKNVLGDTSPDDWSEVAEPLLFAMTARFLGSPLNKFPAEKLQTELFKQRRSFWSKIGL